MSSGGTKRKAVKLMRHDYNVAWICPVSNVELSPARLLLDTKHQTPDYDSNYDDNVYKFGSMGKHNVVLASLPLAMTGNVNAARLTSSVFRTFPNIKIALLVGIGGGVPLSQPQSDPLKDIHLGDVVVGWSTDKSRLSTINYEAGRTHVGGEFEILDHSNRPQWGSLSAISALQNDHELHETEFDVYLDKLRSSDENRKKFSHPGLEHDRLFKADFKHTGDYGNCTRCQQSTTGLVSRPARTSEHAREFVFHFGRIATGGSVIQDGQRRDEISRLCGGILCIEMEVAGVDANSPCLVIRGISDYADSHKNDVWKSYAAGNAAVFARHLLELIPRTVNSKDERRGYSETIRGSQRKMSTAIMALGETPHSTT
ncbi:hypothetical protein GCG54_00005658 [Colletotrichum gloeosporioides]|uniref:Nucleoside phosphorylase domain-containing protein n=1 Tax=Colletotrichum gloeosporioides TaxID=474922 RepID=A0A8H4CKT0_COLGL|nr:uncharacterized protein GCG54_00005658 [Colletotrichum gloeosporioides]KAF3805619.1 hypothetical protein GCG54_00005658 [Colletotrichum gloeosporioides]